MPRKKPTSMPYLLQTKASDTNTVNVLSKDNLKEDILWELLTGNGSFHMLEEVEAKNIVIERLRIESASVEVVKDTIIEFSRGEIKTRIPVNYFMKLNQRINFAVEIDFKVPLIIDGKTELRCVAPDGQVTMLYFWIEKSIDKKSDTTDYDAQFKEFIAQDIFCTDFACIYNPTDRLQTANLIFGANNISVDSDTLSVETNGIGYSVGDKIYFHKALHIKPNSCQLSFPFTIHAPSHNIEQRVQLSVNPNQFISNASEVEEEFIIQSTDAPLISVDVLCGMNYYLFFNKNKKPSYKVNWLYYEPKEYEKKEFDTKEEIAEEIQIMKDRQKQLEGILQEFEENNNEDDFDFDKAFGDDYQSSGAPAGKPVFKELREVDTYLNQTIRFERRKTVTMYFIHKGTEEETEREGPFTIEELVAKKITGDTYIWYDGQSYWRQAKDYSPLRDALKIPVVPPPFKKSFIIG